MYIQKPPESKRELLNRILSHDFNGDLRTLGKGARVSRVNASTLEVRFEDIGRTFHLSVHIPREPGSNDDDFAVELPKSTRKSTTKQ